MINPQSFSKRIGNKKLKLGISISEMVVVSSIPAVTNLLGLETYLSLIIMIALLGIIYLKSFFFEKGQIESVFINREYQEMKRVEIVNKN